MIDLHIHLLPGVDDGAASMEEALEMCRLCADDGVTRVAATAHMFDGMFNVSRSVALEAAGKLTDELERRGQGVVVKPAGETQLVPDLLEKIRNGEVLTLGDDGRYLLVEFPRDVIPETALDMLFDMKLQGITPIISHVARNREIQDEPDCLREFVKAGAVVQVTAESLTGGFGRIVRKCSRKLMEEGMAHIVASDAHSTDRRAPGLSEARRVVEDIVDQQWSDNVLEIWPRQIWNGVSVELPAPASRKRKKGWFFG